MAVTQGQVAELRARVEAKQRERIEHESRAKASREEAARIQAEVKEAFGTETIEDTEALLAREEQALAGAYASLTAAIDDADRAAAGLPS